MIKQRMEIKVALLGNVSAGKTTVLNAILQNKYGEVAKKRTTAGVNYFYLNVTKDVSDTEKHHVAESIHTEISEYNQNKVRDGHDIIKKEFDIDILEPIVRCRKDTVMVLVDIPGINEAGTENKYKEFVSDNWTTFDCAIVVMDGKQGVNTEDQVFILKFVEEHLTKKQIPVIILCNKVDDPLEEEQSELVSEARKEVQKIFNVQCREQSLRSVLEKYQQKQKFEVNMSPAFIPVSAGNAFIYRCGYQMTLEKFQSFDRAIIDSFGRNQLGQKAWNKLSVEKQIEKVFAMVSDDENYIEGIKECNFDIFMNVLDMFVGGEDRQTLLIQKQTRLSLSSVSLEPFTPGKITQAIRIAFTNLAGLDALESFGGIQILQTHFWKAHGSFKEATFKEFQDSWPELNVNVLAGPMKELSLYSDLVVELKWESEKQKITSTGEAWVHRYFKYLLEKNSNMDSMDLGKFQESDGKLTPVDWFMIFDSMLSCNQKIWEMFSDIRTEFSLRSQIASKAMGNNDKSLFCSSCNQNLSPYGTGLACQKCCLLYVDAFPSHCVIHGQRYPYNVTTKKCTCCPTYTYCLHGKLSALTQNYGEGDDLVPSRPDAYKRLVHIKIPRSLNDPYHFGHVPFEFFQLMEQMSLCKE